MWDLFPWAQAIIGAISLGFGIIELKTGWSPGRHARGYTRDESPDIFWLSVATCFFVSLAFAYSGVKQFLQDRKDLSDGDGR
jgi:hypothetical protein